MSLGDFSFHCHFKPKGNRGTGRGQEVGVMHRQPTRYVAVRDVLFMCQSLEKTLRNRPARELFFCSTVSQLGAMLPNYIMGEFL